MSAAASSSPNKELSRTAEKKSRPREEGQTHEAVAAMRKLRRECVEQGRRSPNGDELRTAIAAADAPAIAAARAAAGGQASKAGKHHTRRSIGGLVVADENKSARSRRQGSRAIVGGATTASDEAEGSGDEEDDGGSRSATGSRFQSASAPSSTDKTLGATAAAKAGTPAADAREAIKREVRAAQNTSAALGIVIVNRRDAEVERMLKSGKYSMAEAADHLCATYDCLQTSEITDLTKLLFTDHVFAASPMNRKFCDLVIKNRNQIAHPELIAAHDECERLERKFNCITGIDLGSSFGTQMAFIVNTDKLFDKARESRTGGAPPILTRVAKKELKHEIDLADNYVGTMHDNYQLLIRKLVEVYDVDDPRVSRYLRYHREKYPVDDSDSEGDSTGGTESETTSVRSGATHEYQHLKGANQGAEATTEGYEHGMGTGVVSDAAVYRGSAAPVRDSRFAHAQHMQARLNAANLEAASTTHKNKASSSSAEQKETKRHRTSETGAAAAAAGQSAAVAGGGVGRTLTAEEAAAYDAHMASMTTTTGKNVVKKVRRITMRHPDSRVPNTATVAEPRLVLRVRMVKVSQRSRSGANHEMVGFVSNTGVTAVEYSTRLIEYYRIADVPLDTYVNTLLYLIEDPSRKAELSKLTIRVGETLADHFERVVAAFESAFMPTRPEERSNRKIARKQHIGLQEDIRDFITRFQMMYAANHPDDVSSAAAFELFTELLHPDFQVYTQNWVITTQAAARAMDPDEASGMILVTSWDRTCSLTKMYYAHRSNDIKIKGERYIAHLIMKNRRSEESHESQPLVVTKYMGTHSRSLESRYQDASNNTARYHTPEADEGLIRRLTKARHNSPESHHVGPERVKQAAHVMAEASAAKRKHHDHDDSHDESHQDGERQGRRKQKRVRAVKTEERPHNTSNSSRAPPSSSFTSGGNRSSSANDRPSKPAKTDPGMGPCPSCCQFHEWVDCHRNKASARYTTGADKHIGSCMPETAQVNLDETKQRYGRVGLSQGGVPPQQLAGYKQSQAYADAARNFSTNGSSQRKTQMIRFGPHGQRDIVINGDIDSLRQVQFFVDTGSQVSILSLPFYRRWAKELGPMGEPPEFSLRTADNSETSVAGTLQCAVSFTNPENGFRYTRDIKFVIMDELGENALAGLNLLTSFFSNIGLRDGHPTFLETLVPDAGSERDQTYSTSVVKPSGAIQVVRTLVLKSGEFRYVTVRHPIHAGGENGTTLFCRATQNNAEGKKTSIDFAPHAYNGGSLDAHGRYQLMVHNPTKRVVCLRGGHTIGQATVINRPAEMDGIAHRTYTLSTMYDPSIEPKVHAFVEPREM